jgi:hypothetical protein
MGRKRQLDPPPATAAIRSAIRAQTREAARGGVAMRYEIT